MRAAQQISFARPSTFRMKALPIVSVLLASALPAMLPIIAQFPLLPPFGLILFVAWRLIRAELWPSWIGIPLGFWDDLFSGQPFGSGILLWTIIVLAFEFADRILVWRDWWVDWLMAAAAIAFGIAGGLVIIGLTGTPASMEIIVPQLVWSIFTYPLVTRLVAVLDRWRLGRNN